MKRIVVLVFMFIVSNAFALSFHYGDRSVELTTIKHTSPALHVRNNGIIYYGALFNVNDYTVPTNVVHIRYEGEEYFLSPWCDAGQYPSPETNECIPCGLGHYCTGGHHRESCTYGIIACNGVNHTYDPPMPNGTDGMYNRALTMAEIEQYVPQTDIEQWEKFFKETMPQSKTCASGENYPDNPDINMYDIVIGPGTYVATHVYPWAGTTGSFGDSDTVESAYMFIFDHSVVYRPVHVCNHFGNYFDTQHVPYQNYDIQCPATNMLANENITNIENIGDTFYAYRALGLYRLK